MSRRKNVNDNQEEYIEAIEQQEDNRSFVEKNQFLIIAIAAGILLLVGAFLAYKYLYQAPQEQKAKEQLYRAELQFKQDSFALALENPGGGYDGFLDIIDNYGSTKAGNLSKYYAGISYLNLGKFDAAVDFLNDFSPTGKVTPITKYGAMGDAYSELGEFDKAISFYRKASSAKANDFLSPYYLKKLGMLLERQGDASAANQAYTQIKEKFPKSNEGGTIQMYINRTQG